MQYEWRQHIILSVPKVLMGFVVAMLAY